ncbi:MAG: hypothetical protein JKY96_05965 [Phycisphaerales bacterium]|nr:hypothetical protein [Phycisphaerales bacterium]
MRLIITCTFLTLLLGYGLLVPGCGAPRKIKTTLASNEVLVQAGAAEDAGETQKAYELWTRYVELRPHEAKGEYRLGRIENQLGKYADASNHLRIAHDLKPGNIIYIEELASALANGGQHSELISMLNASASEGPDGSGYLRLARYAAQAGMMDEAREALLGAIAVNGRTSPTSHLAMADFARDIGDVDNEVLSLRHVLWFDPANAVILERIRSLGVIPGPSLAIDPR